MSNFQSCVQRKVKDGSVSITIVKSNKSYKTFNHLLFSRSWFILSIEQNDGEY